MDETTEFFPTPHFDRNSSGSSSSSSTRFGNYELIEIIAQGGMGIVYRACDTRLNRLVALKMIISGHLATAREVGRFKIEAEAVARLDHPNIVPIYEIGESEGRHFLAMKLVDGESLAQAICTRNFTPILCGHLLAKLARAVQYAHEHGVLHRDIKPSNILIDKYNEPHLTDFGLAKIIESDLDLTGSFTVMGSAKYMAPEQARGENRQLASTADIYSLGAVLYELLAGQPPFDGKTLVETLEKVIKDDPKPISSFQRSVDADLETICLKCLEKDPRRRYSSAEQLAIDLERWLHHEPVSARPVSLLRRAVKWVRRKPVMATLIAMLLLTLIFTITGTIYHFSQLSLRLHHLLVEQARAERLLGHPEQSLKLLGEAARLRSSAAARTEAIQTLSQPGMRLVFESPFGSFATKLFSPDGSLYAVGGQVPHWEHAQIKESTRVRLWALPTGQRLPEIDWDLKGGPFAFSPDSRRLAVPQQGNSVILWDPWRGQTIGLIPFFGAPLFSSDGAHIAIASSNLIRVFEVATLSQKHQLAGRASLIAHWAPGILLWQEWLSNGESHLRRWDYIHNEMTTLNSHHAVASLSADGRIAALRPLQGKNPGESLLLTATETGAELAHLISFSSGTRVILSPDGMRVAISSTSEPGRILISDARSGQFITGLGEMGVKLADRFEGYHHLGPSLFVERSSKPSKSTPWLCGIRHFSNDGAFFVAGSLSGAETLFLWELGSGRKVAELPGASYPVWSPDDRWIGVEQEGQLTLSSSNTTYSKSGRVTAQVWEIMHGTPAHRLTNGVQSLAFSSDNARLAAQNTLWKLRRQSERILIQPDRSTSNEEVIRFAGDEAWAVKGWPFYGSPGLSFRSILSSTEPFEPVSWRQAMSYAFSPDGRRVLIASTGDRDAPQGEGAEGKPHFQLWDLQQRQRLAFWMLPTISGVSYDQIPGPIAFSPDGRLAAAACFLRQGFLLWDSSSGRHLRHFGPAFVPSEDGYWAKRMPALFRRSGVEPHREQGIRHLLFTPDNQWIIYAWKDRVLIRNILTGVVVGEICPDSSMINGVALSPDGQILATGTDGHTIYLWEVPSGRELARWKGHEMAIWSLVFSPDGTMLASGSREGTFKVWLLSNLRRELATLGLDW